jgi:GNAT superfamily N-acetyltransferase
MEYVRSTSRLPTFLSLEQSEIHGFVTLQQHFPHSFEIVCLAVRSAYRNKGMGRALVEHASAWAHQEGGEFLQVKTLADSHPSREYADTRAFYSSVGFVGLEVFPLLWAAEHPCLVMVRHLSNVA